MKRLQLAAGALLCAVHLGIGATEVAYLTAPSWKVSAPRPTPTSWATW